MISRENSYTPSMCLFCGFVVALCALRGVSRNGSVQQSCFVAVLLCDIQVSVRVSHILALALDVLRKRCEAKLTYHSMVLDKVEIRFAVTSKRYEGLLELNDCIRQLLTQQ
jgi:hypothetical protein